MCSEITIPSELSCCAPEKVYKKRNSDSIIPVLANTW